jgi:lipid II:glycine glycyltransferase (peptidoglycan interpeptide bridge formation enzyme)
VKIEPEIEDGDDTRRALRRFGLARARHDIQITRATIVVDLRPDEDAILASFKPKTRYNIRLAARRGVRVDAVPVNDTTMGAMYELMQATQQRAGFTLRPREYFRRYWRLQAATGQGQLFFATWREQTLAGAFVTRLAAKAWYKDGGSTKEHADLMAPHLLQWEVMRWLRRHGTASYDLVAVPARAELHAQHPLFGLYRFKSGFSEHIREYVGTWDLVLSPPRYRLWDAVVERAQHQWAYRVRHDLLY